MSRHAISRFLAVLGLGFTLTASTLAQQSLGDAARQVRKSKPAEPTTKVITNDDLGVAPQGRVLETPDKASTDSGKANSTAGAADAKKPEGDADKSDKPKTPADEQAKLDKEWQDKIAGQKDQIALLERELDVLVRENKLRTTNYYADAGTRLRNEKQFAEDDRKYHDQIQAKQKEVDDAKSKLDQMREEARKAGASPGAIS